MFAVQTSMIIKKQIETLLVSLWFRFSECRNVLHLTEFVLAGFFLSIILMSLSPCQLWKFHKDHTVEQKAIQLSTGLSHHFLNSARI